MQTSIDLLRRLSSVKGRYLRMVEDRAVGSFKHRINLSLMEADGEILIIGLPYDSLVRLLRQGWVEKWEVRSTRDISVYRLTRAGITRAGA
jgi:hypothetical protein